MNLQSLNALHIIAAYRQTSTDLELLVGEFKRFDDDLAALGIEVGDVPFFWPGIYESVNLQRLVLVVQHGDPDSGRLDVEVVNGIFAPLPQNRIDQQPALEYQVGVARPHGKFVGETVFTTFAESLFFQFDGEAGDIPEVEVVVADAGNIELDLEVEADRWIAISSSHVQSF